MEQQSSARKEIDHVNSQFVQAFNRGDAAGAVSVYSEDATILPPGSNAIQGRQGIQQFWQGAMDMGIRAVDLQTESLSEEGDVAWEIGRATLTIRPAGGQELTETAKYVVIWKRAAGTWQWTVDIWNSNG